MSVSSPGWRERFLSSAAARQSPERAKELLKEFELRHGPEGTGRFCGVAGQAALGTEGEEQC